MSRSNVIESYYDPRVVQPIYRPDGTRWYLLLEGLYLAERLVGGAVLLKWKHGWGFVQETYFGEEAKTVWKALSDTDVRPQPMIQTVGGVNV